MSCVSYFCSHGFEIHKSFLIILIIAECGEVMTRNEYAYVAIIILAFVVVAFSTGYWSGLINQSNTNENSTLELETRLNALESRMSEQLLIVPNAMSGLQFEIINIGNVTVSLSDIKINDVKNDSSPGWIVQNDNMLLAGEMSNVTINSEKYLVRITGTLIFSFTTTRGNIYYCVFYANQEIQSGGYTSFEQIELPSTYAQVVNATTWKVTIDLRNTGSAAATIDSVFLNAVPLKDYSSGWALNYSTNTGGDVTTYTSLGISIPNGNTVTLYLYLTTSIDGCSAGTNIDLKMHTAAGKDYPTRVKLP
jgi:hypothetical protein